MFLVEIYRRLARSVFFLAIVLAIGTFGYWYIGRSAGHDYALADCLYMTAITIASVGYTEVFPVREVPYMQGFTMVLILLGVLSLVYFSSAVLALFVESDLRHAWRQTRMRKVIDRMKNHIIVCGAGATGATVIRELVAIQHEFVAIDTDAERLKRIESEIGAGKVPHIAGDATDDDVLLQAGIERARGVVVALPEDKDNLFVTVSARQLNPGARIVARGIESGTAEKLKRAGANEVISPNAIGGMRMVSVMVRPTVVEFLDKMLRDREKNLRIEEVPIPEGSPLAGKALKDTPIRKITDLLVIAAYQPDSAQDYVYNPGPDFVLRKGVVIIVLGMVDDVVRLRKYVNGETANGETSSPR